jgi:hypothetical protein
MGSRAVATDAAHEPSMGLDLKARAFGHTSKPSHQLVTLKFEQTAAGLASEVVMVAHVYPLKC